MQQLIQKERKKRKSREYNEEELLLIGEGGYISPNDHLWLDVLFTVTLKKPVLLKGPAGAGKTKMAESISDFFHQPIHSINCSVDLDAESLLGFKTIVQKDGETFIEFIEGPVIKAMKEGHLLYIDEINMAKAETLPILHSVLDYRRMLTNPFTGEVIVAHPDFSVIAAINEGYIGTAPMNEALKNRFVSFSIPYLNGEQLEELWKERFPDLSENLRILMLQLAEDLKQQVINGLLSEEAASVRSLLDATELAQYMDPLRAIRYAIAEKLDDPSEKELVLELAKTWMK
ncbi:CbbQ/NirQ/NorQ/GpvN family protein [Rummeliibacillus stabekisii]|uniref:AAA family ATPase n=1 Tax=Rummeliibacillus stabekisii TaxID=241244 RepID=UPI00204108D0|nr:AAA family ATPase [Rummeliibacillus stabekisii]MCM3316540.1 CbbQ/NirQ/NorQ/GpvN family protein [Rummeliibacillus stabekisii]